MVKTWMVTAVVLATAVVSQADMARAQGAIENCSSGQIRLSASEQTAAPGIVTVEVMATTSTDCIVEDLSALLFYAEVEPVPGVSTAEIDVGRTITADRPELLATLLWRNWCDDPALGPYGVAIKTFGAEVRVPRLASIPLCFDDTQGVIFEFELSAPSGEQVQPGPLSIGRHIEGLLRTGDASAVADLHEAREFTCPGDPVFGYAACENQPDGTVITGYETGIWASQGTVFARDGYIAFLEHELGLLASDDIRLYTVAESGFGGCPECGVLVFSTPSDVAATDGTARMILIQVRPVSGQFRIFNTIGGFVSLPQEAPVVLGGEHGGQTYISIEPAAPEPPDTGTGLASSTGKSDPWLIVAALLTVAAAALAPRSPRRQPKTIDQRPKTSD